MGEGTAMAEGTTTFRKLSEEMVCELFKKFGIPVRIGELKAPTKEFIVRIFQHVLLHFKIELNSQLPIPWNALQHLESPELYENTFPIVHLTLCMNKIMQPCGINVTLKDIVDPKPKRTLMIMNHLVVFLSYYLKKTMFFKEVEKKYEDEIKKAESISLAICALEEKIEERSKILEERKQDKEKLLEKIDINEEIVEKGKKQTEIVTSTYQEYKSQEAVLIKKKADIDVNIAHCKEKLEEFNQQILSSPDRMNAEIATLKERVKELCNKIKDMDNKIKLKKKDLSQLGASQVEACKATDILTEINSELELLSTETENFLSTRVNNADELKLCEKLESEIKGMEEQKMFLEGNTAKVNLNTIKQKEAMQEILIMHKRDMQKEEKGLLSLQEKCTNFEQEIKSAEKIIEENLKKYESCIAEFKRKEIAFYVQLEQMKSKFDEDSNQAKETLKKYFEK